VTLVHLVHQQSNYSKANRTQIFQSPTFSDMSTHLPKLLTNNVDMFNLPEKITKISSTPISKNGDATKDARDTRKYEKSQKFHKKNSPAPPIKNVMFPLRLLRDVKTSDIESLEHMYSRYFLRYLEGSRKPSDSGGEGGGQNDSFCFMRTVSDEEQDVVRGSRYNSIDFQGLANLTVKIYSDIQLAEDAPTTDDALKISRKNRQSEVTREVLDTLVRRSCSNANSADKPSKFITEVALAHASEYFRIESIGTLQSISFSSWTFLFFLS